MSMFARGRLFAAMLIASSVVLAAYENMPTAAACAVALVYGLSRPPHSEWTSCARTVVAAAILAADWHNPSPVSVPAAFAALYV